MNTKSLTANMIKYEGQFTDDVSGQTNYRFTMNAPDGRRMGAFVSALIGPPDSDIVTTQAFRAIENLWNQASR